MKDFDRTTNDNTRQLGHKDLIEEEPFNYSSDITDEIKTDETWNASKLEEEIKKEKLSPFVDFKGVFDGGPILSNWKRYKRLNAKIIEIHEDHVKLECLIDEENEIYQEKIMAKHLFDSVALKESHYLRFNYYKKDNEMKIEILDDQRLFSNSEFPRVDFSKFEKSNFLNQK